MCIRDSYNVVTNRAPILTSLESGPYILRKNFVKRSLTFTSIEPRRKIVETKKRSVVNSRKILRSVVNSRTIKKRGHQAAL